MKALFDPDSRWRPWLLAAAALVVVGLLAAGWLGAKEFREVRRQHRVQRALDQVRKFTELRQPEQALLALRIAQAEAPQDVDVSRSAAESLEKLGSSQTVPLRRQILLATGTLADRLALARAALASGNLPTATETLAGVPDADREDPAYRQLAILHALSTGRIQQAETLLRDDHRTSRLPPSFQILAASLTLRRADGPAKNAAREALERQTAEPAQRRSALRALLDDALHRADYARALALSARTLALPEADTHDLIIASELQELVWGRAPAELAAQLAQRARASAPEAAEYALWLGRRERAPEARAWLDTLSPELKALPWWRAAHADLAAGLGDWATVNTLVAAGAWGPLPDTVASLAASAWDLRCAGRTAEARRFWAEVLEAGRPRLASLRVLVRLAEAWRWDDARLDAWIAVNRGFPEEVWAYTAQLDHFQARRDTPGLLKVLATWRRADPNRELLKHDWALLSLTAAPATEPNEATRLLEELHRLAPTNPVYITGHAFALAQLGRGAEAARLVEELAPGEREAPNRQHLLAYVFARAGRRAEAGACLERVRLAPLLDEERELVVRTRALLGA